ncbi:hypothetical protein Tco_0052102 [Tanacetum coccineum]
MKNFMRLPNSVEDYTGSDRLNGLGVLSQKLCVISCIYNGDCEVWLLMDHKWVKYHVLPPFDGDQIMPTSFTPYNLFLFGIGRHLALYDPNATVIKLFNSIMNTPNSFTKVVLYVDCLIWPPPLGDTHDWVEGTRVSEEGQTAGICECYLSNISGRKSEIKLVERLWCNIYVTFHLIVV